MTEKLAPPLDSGDGLAFVVPDDVAIVMASYCHEESLTVPTCPFRVAWELEKYTVPKSESGRTPEPEDGASAIHSAEDLLAFLSVWVVE